ncbi:MAG: photosystem II repair protein Psb32 [Aphanizomenon sp.]|jgi:uncharacterized protein
MQQLLKQSFSNQNFFIRLILPVLVMVMASTMFILPASATGVYEMPSFTADTWILDQGDVISRLNEGEISKAFKDLAQETGYEARIVTIHRLDYEETPESFAKELFTKWFPTATAQANQVLLLVDTVTNGTALVSGDQIKSLLTDSIAQSVAEETLGTALREGNKYNQGFSDVSDRLVAVLSGKTDPGPPQIKQTVKVEGTFTKAEETNQGNATAWVIGLLIAATVIPMATYYIYLVFQKPPSQKSEE